MVLQEGKDRKSCDEEGIYTPRLSVTLGQPSVRDTRTCLPYQKKFGTSSNSLLNQGVRPVLFKNTSFKKLYLRKVNYDLSNL